jgi:hypothetical protein
LLDEWAKTDSRIMSSTCRDVAAELRDGPHAAQVNVSQRQHSEVMRKRPCRAK